MIQGDFGVVGSGDDVDEIAKLRADLVAAGFIEPTTCRCAGAATDLSCGSPQNAGKDPCGDCGAVRRATRVRQAGRTG